jgi:tetratricopeptide (TPR) repeat protein
LPGCSELVDEIDEQLRQAHRANAAQQLHALTERLRLLAGSDDLSESEVRAAEGHCRTAWEMRGHFMGNSRASLRDAEAEQARADLIDLALLWTDLKQRLAPADQAIQTESRSVLAEAQSLCGPSHALAWKLTALGGEANPAAGPIAPTFRDHAALGRALLRDGSLDRAAEELERAVELRPTDFWSHYYGGLCAFRLGRHAEAIASFNVAIALAPEFAEIYYNRALAHTAAGYTASALRDYDRALTLAPTLAPAALNRGILHHQHGNDAHAIADLKRALECGAEPTAANYNLALVHLAKGERAAALDRVECALRTTPTHLQARLLRERLLGQD